jgi:hypothetical protein
MATNANDNKPIKRPKRVIICAADIMRLTGKHYNTALRMMQLVREAYGKSSSGLITVTEFATVWEIEENIIYMFMD